MKILGVKQFQKKKFKFLEIPDEWKKHIGRLPETFIGIIFGDAGDGKSEYCIRFAKMLCRFGRVAWLDYEQGHDPDLQIAINRNKMEEVHGIFLLINPLENRTAGLSLFQELEAYLSKRGTPRFIFINSLRYFELTIEQYYYLKAKYKGKKALIFINHVKNNLPESRVGNMILGDGQFGIRCRKLIAQNNKNRIGGKDDLIIWDEGARQKFPAYFKNEK